MLICYAIPGIAQTTDLEVSVEYIAGQNIYLNVGSESGIVRRDTIEVYRGTVRQGRLRVISITSRRAVTTFVGDRFPVDFADQLTIRFRAADVVSAQVDDAEKDEQAKPARASILTSSGSSTSNRRKNGVRASGRVSFETQSLRTLTDARADSLPRIRSSFSSTNASVRTTVDRLPFNLKANLHFRAAYRKSSTVTTLSPQSIRVYRASIEKRLTSTPLSFEIGRFYSIHEDFSGYWDGAIVRYGPRRMGGGFAVGFEPTLSNEGFDPDLPKYTAFADFQARSRNLRYDADVSFHEIRGRNQYSKHDYIGFQQALRARRIRITQDLQVNRDPETSTWMITRFQTTAAAPITNRLRVTGRYLVRRPYYVWRTQNFMSTRRDRLTLGASIRLKGGVTGVNVTSNGYEGQDPYTTYSTYLNFTETPVAGIGFSSSASFWSRNNNQAFSANTGLTKRFGRLFLRGRYRYYQTSISDATFRTHGVNSSVDFRLPERISLTVQVQYQFGDTFQNTSVFTGLWKSF